MDTELIAQALKTPAGFYMRVEIRLCVKVHTSVWVFLALP